MIKQSNAMTFTKRLNYSVSEIPVEEFLSILSNYGETEQDKKRVENIQSKLRQIQ